MIDDGAWIRWALRAARSERDLDAIILDTGIDMVDSDHRILLRYAVQLNNLLDGVSTKGIDEEAIAAQASLIGDFTSYTKYHFDRELLLVERLRAPGLERQRREHASIVESIADYAAQFAAGRTGVPEELRGTVFSWIVSHIADSDRQTFRIEALAPTLAEARTWSDLADIVRTTGIDELDAEHKEIIERIIEAAHALRAGGGGRGLEALERLRLSAERHFTHEEQLLDAFAASNAAEQKSSHAGFLQTIATAAAACRDHDCLPEGESSAMRDLSLELLSWLVSHIGQVDYNSFRRGRWMATAFESATTPKNLHLLIRKTGVEEIDQDHRKFIELSFSVVQEMESRNRSKPRKTGEQGDGGSRGNGQEPRDPRAATDSAEAIDSLARFAKGHFAREAQILAENPTRFPARLVARHHDEHVSLEAAFSALRDDAAAGRIEITGALRNKLSAWWIGHTNGTDIETFGSAVADAGGRHEKGE